uniref:THH1/TOM1/TOM3 domain-containing protein n=1 Tax=Quercus lobata TaxID=97700 RepID=A0A7N2MCK6_QUELO
MMMLLDLEAEAQTRDCFHGNLLLILDIVLASINGILATIAFSQILDSVLIANECLDSRQKSGVPMVLCKLDVEKTYDHVNWDFLIYMLDCCGFLEKWRSKKLDKAVRDDLMSGVRVGPTASDVLVEVVYGVKINMGKFELVPVGVVPNIANMVNVLGCKQGSFPMKYLGLLLGANVRDFSIWNPIIEKMERRLAGWKWLYLSIGAHQNSFAESTKWMDTSKRMNVHLQVLHLMIGSSNLGYFVYFISALVATSEGWICWSNVCGFLLLAFPKILFLATFLLVLSFWVDLCHQANDEEDDDDETSIQQTLLEKLSKPRSSNTDSHWRCCSFHGIHIGTRQKFVITVVVLVFVLMMTFAVIIWIGAGKNPIDSSVVARVFEDFLAVTSLSLGGALGCYGLMLFLKLKKVRSEKGSSEVWKVAGLAIVSVVCFTSSASVALLTDIPLFYHWHLKKINRVKEVVLLILYYFIGCSVPSAVVLWNMRELPPPIKIHKQEQSRAIAFISHGAVATHPPQRWTNATSSKNQSYDILVEVGTELCPQLLSIKSKSHIRKSNGVGKHCAMLLPGLEKKCWTHKPSVQNELELRRCVPNI